MSAATRAKLKIERVRAVLEHREPDRVPIGEFFWSGFVQRAQRELGMAGPFDPYRHWDLDLIVVNPNMDPHLTGIQVLEQSAARRVVRTGFGAVIEQRPTCPMPLFRSFDTQTGAQMDALRFDDPRDER